MKCHNSCGREGTVRCVVNHEMELWDCEKCFMLNFEGLLTTLKSKKEQDLRARTSIEKSLQRAKEVLLEHPELGLEI